jgi:hypothetical protein
VGDEAPATDESEPMRLPRRKVGQMKEHSNEWTGLRAAFGRAALAVFAFAALTAVPLLSDTQLGDQAQTHVASVAAQGNASIQEDTSCRI